MDLHGFTSLYANWWFWECFHYWIYHFGFSEMILTCSVLHSFDLRSRIQDIASVAISSKCIAWISDIEVLRAKGMTHQGRPCLPGTPGITLPLGSSVLWGFEHPKMPGSWAIPISMASTCCPIILLFRKMCRKALLSMRKNKSFKFQRVSANEFPLYSLQTQIVLGLPKEKCHKTYQYNHHHINYILIIHHKVHMFSYWGLSENRVYSQL